MANLSYNKFLKRIESKLSNNRVLYQKLLEKMIKEPSRYVSDSRINSFEMKVLQNILQSKEIKFGSFLEEIVSEYIEINNFQLFNKNIKNTNQQTLLLDHLFSDGSNYYFVEQKIRDDHDSTKKAG